MPRGGVAKESGVTGELNQRLGEDHMGKHRDSMITGKWDSGASSSSARRTMAVEVALGPKEVSPGGECVFSEPVLSQEELEDGDIFNSFGFGTTWQLDGYF
jgi:hypothetical protein